VPVELLGDRNETAQQRQASGCFARLVLVAVPEDLDASVDQEHAEDQQHPPELGDERRAEDDERGAQGEGAEDAPEQDAVLILEWDRHRCEQHRPHEHVVDAERLLDQVATDVLTERAAAELDRDEDRETEPARDPDRGLRQGFLRRRRVVVAMAEQVDGKHRRDGRSEKDPRPQGDVEVDERLGSEHRWGHGKLLFSADGACTGGLPHPALVHARDSGAGPDQGYELDVLTTRDLSGYSPPIRQGYRTLHPDER